MRKSCSLVQASAVLGVHRNTLSAWLDKGCPFLTRADRSQGIEWELEIPAIFEWRVEQAAKEAITGAVDADGNMTKDEADRRRAVAMAYMAEIELDQVLKRTVDINDAATVMADFCQVLRSGLSNAGSKIAGRASTMTNPSEIRDFCEEELNRAFRAAREDLNEQWDRVSEVAPQPSKDQNEHDDE